MSVDETREPNATDESKVTEGLSPVRPIPTDTPEKGPQPGIALCLSGGGFRAMLFHVGALWRLNELGWLSQLDRVSSVSGGSITAGVLAHGWPQLAFDTDGVAGGFDAAVVAPLRKFAGETVDVQAGLKGIFLPGSIAHYVAGRYDRDLFHGATLQSLPDHPRFVFNSTNLQSGVLWRFSKPYMWDYRVGKVPQPKEKLATAVAASSAFPPLLSPLKLELSPSDYEPGTGTDLEQPAYQRRPVLSDGGVYDNLGLETAWKRYTTILVSDGGGHFTAKERIATNWPLQSVRVLGVIDGQVRALRKRQVVGGLAAGLRAGAYWSIWSHVADFKLPDALPADEKVTEALAKIPTRLGKLDRAQQEKLINWGYVICDTGMRKHVLPGTPPPASLPYPAADLR
jgi:NTE family protein